MLAFRQAILGKRSFGAFEVHWSFGIHKITSWQISFVFPNLLKAPADHILYRVSIVPRYHSMVKLSVNREIYMIPISRPASASCVKRHFVE